MNCQVLNCPRDGTEKIIVEQYFFRDVLQIENCFCVEHAEQVSNEIEE